MCLSDISIALDFYIVQPKWSYFSSQRPSQASCMNFDALHFKCLLVVEADYWKSGNLFIQGWAVQCICYLLRRCGTWETILCSSIQLWAQKKNNQSKFADSLYWAQKGLVAWCSAVQILDEVFLGYVWQQWQYCRTKLWAGGSWYQPF